jgi:hypothetical protein
MEDWTMSRTTHYNAKVECFFDPSKNKLRVAPINGEGFVRFPNKLREDGAIYKVEILEPGKGGSWIAKGSISRVA